MREKRREEPVVSRNGFRRRAAGRRRVGAAPVIRSFYRGRSVRLLKTPDRSGDGGEFLRLFGGLTAAFRPTSEVPPPHRRRRMTGVGPDTEVRPGAQKAGFPGPLHFQPDCLHVKLLSRLQTDARSSSVRKALFRPIFLRKNRALRTEVSTHPFQIVDQCFPIARQMPEAPL